jgi:hypothetical protein
MAAWFRARYDDAEGRPGCAAFGRSIIPRLVPQPEISSERGYPVFNPNQTAIRALQHDGDRERSREAGDGQLAQSVHRVLEHVRPLGEGATLRERRQIQAGLLGSGESLLSIKASGRNWISRILLVPGSISSLDLCKYGDVLLAGLSSVS